MSMFARSSLLRRKPFLIALDWTRPKDPPLSLGHASILSGLRHHNIDAISAEFAVNKSSFNVENVIDEVMQASAKYGSSLDVAIGAFVWNEKPLQQIISRLKQLRFPGRIVLGGPQISYSGRGLEKLYPNVDVFIRGHGEETFLALAQAPLNEKVKMSGIHYANEPDTTSKAESRLDALVSPFLEGLIQPQRFIRWETQRGCPFRCAFCQHRQPDKTMLKRRNLGLDRVEQEALWILNYPIIQDIAVLDPTFNSGGDYMKVLQKLEGYTGKLSLQCRIEMVNDEFLEAVCNINRTGRVVLEFGLQTIHHEEMRIIKRGNNMRKVSKILDQIQAMGIESEISLIYGLPGQTLESFKQSVDFCLEKSVPTIHAFPLMLLRGTELHDQKDALQLVESNDVDSDVIPRQFIDIPHVVSSMSFSKDDWLQMHALAEWLELSYNQTSKPAALQVKTV